MPNEFILLNTDIEYEYNNPKNRLRQNASIRIYEDDRINELERNQRTLFKKLDIIIKMISKLGYEIDKKR